MNSKKALGGILGALAILLVSIATGTVLMIGVYMLPTGRMLTNVVESYEIIDTEGGSFTWAPGYPGSRLDGFTDNIMLQTAVLEGSGNPIRDAMLNRRMDFPKAQLSPGNALINYVYGARNGEITTYGRYWHGYLLFLKPLLLFFNLSDIRMMLMTVQFSLAAALLCLVYKRKGPRLAVPLGLALICLNPVSTAMSMQFTSIYLLTLLFALAELQIDSFSKKRGWVLYLLLGVCTAFFDFLTYPPAAFGICVLLEILLFGGSAKEKLKKTILSGLSWGLGYGGMWSGKWLVGSLLTGQNILADAITTAHYRTGTGVAAGEGTAAAYPEILAKNLGALMGPGCLILFGALAILFLWLLVSKKCRFAPDSTLLPALGLIALVPFAWYFVLKNHSSVHYWMTYRNLSVTVMALAAYLSFSLKDKGDRTNG